MTEPRCIVCHYLKRCKRLVNGTASTNKPPTDKTPTWEHFHVCTMPLFEECVIIDNPDIDQCECFREVD